MQTKPNIILINCDDMGYGDLGCYGSSCNDTPFIDRLAHHGIKYTSCYAASPVCTPSRASLMTGCYPPRISINRVLFPGEEFGLSVKEYTMPRMFKDQGYRTKIVGKWHCGDQFEFLPKRFGFDEYYGIPYSNDMGIQKGVRIDRSPLPTPLPLIDGDEVIEEQPDQRSLTERYTEQCIKFIRQNKDFPFFLYYAQMHVHLPLYAEEEFCKLSRNGDFGACMSELDWSCHCIFDELNKLNLLENTLIVFTSDNGSRGDHGASNYPLRGNKLRTWEGGIRVPCIMYWKNHLPENAVYDHMISHIDFLNLFAHVIGAKLPNKFKTDGMDIYDTVFNNQEVRSDFVYCGSGGPKADGCFLCAVRKGKWKAHFQRREDDGYQYSYVNELYDLESDIGETHNVWDQYPEIVADLEKMYNSYKIAFGDKGDGTIGREVRDCGHALNPRPLAYYDENHPYIVAMYDKSDMG